MSTAKTLITAEEFMQMSFDRPVELVRGEIVEVGDSSEAAMPERRHGEVCLRIGATLLRWADDAGAGTPASNDSFVLTKSDPDSLRGADVCFFRSAKVEAGALEPEHVDIPPDLCVEVLSPSNSWREVSEKIDEYLACGVDEIWIVDAELRSIQVYGRGTHRIVRSGETIVSDVLPGFEADIDRFFGPV